jgi:hypothetical protein
MTKPPYKPTQKQLEGAPEKVYYELDALRTAVGLSGDRSLWGRHLFGSIVRDSILLHARNLRDFLCKRPGPKDDIVAGHFVANEDDEPWTSASLSFTSSRIERMNKLRNHLTYTRVASEYKWSFEEIDRIREEIDNAYAEFLSRLPARDRNKWKS